MSEPAYVKIAGEIARDIRSGALRARTQLPSYSELAKEHGVSGIVIRKVIDLLLRQGLVYTIERRGTFVAPRPTLVRVSPERQMEDPEVTFGNEAATDEDVRIERESSLIPADDELAALLGVEPTEQIEHIVTMASERGRPVSISDTYQRPESDVTAANVLEETVADRTPVPTHAVWLEIASGDLVKTVRQRFFAPEGQVLMVSDVSYPRDRYESFVFRMAL